MQPPEVPIPLDAPKPEAPRLPTGPAGPKTTVEVSPPDPELAPVLTRLANTDGDGRDKLEILDAAGAASEMPATVGEPKDAQPTPAQEPEDDQAKVDTHLAEQAPAVEDHWDVGIIKSVLTKGLVPSAQRNDERVDSLSSATATGGNPTTHGNILVPKLEGHYDEEKNEFRFVAPAYDNDTRQLYRPIVRREGDKVFGKPFDWPRRYGRNYQRYMDGEKDRELVEDWEYKLDPIQRILYRSNFGVLPVVAERPWIIPQTSQFDSGSPAWQHLTQHEVEEMMAASFMVVVNYDNVYKGETTHFMLNNDLNPHEYNTPDTVPPSDFEYILVPEKLRSRFEGLDLGSLRDKIRFVGERQARVSYADKWAGYPMKVPDYEGALREIITERSNDVFWIHGVRLPATQDYVRKAQEAEQREWREFDETRKMK